MKKTIEREVTVCDVCSDDEPADYKCDECGIEYCYECKKLRGVTYGHAVNFSGSSDGYYCNECDAKLSTNGGNKLYNAYKKIQYLRAELHAFSETFNKRRIAAEQQLQGILDDET